MNIGNKLLIFSVGLAIAAASCKKPEPVDNTCTAPATPKASNDSPKPLNSTIQLTASTVEGATYSWTGPNKFSSTAQNPTITYTGNLNLGEYSVVAIVNGCTSARAYTYITACDTPTVTTNSPVAMGGTLNFSTDVIPGATYAWTKVGNPAFSSNEPSFSLAASSDSIAGTYEVVITYNGCTTPKRSTTVVIVPSTPTITGTTTYTTGATLNLTATSTTPGVTYRWTRPNRPDTVTQVLSMPNIARRNAGEYKVVAIKNGLQSAAASKTVTVNFNTTAGCQGITSVTDRGFTYTTVEIQSGATKQCWLRQNLKQTATDSLWQYDEMMNVIQVTTTQQGMCPVGFHVPSDAEWTTLATAAGNSSDPLKAVQTGSTGTNTTGFTMGFGTNFPTATYWTYTWNPNIDGTQNWIYYRLFRRADNSIFRDIIKKNPSTAIPNYAVRCIKD